MMLSIASNELVNTLRQDGIAQGSAEIVLGVDLWQALQVAVADTVVTNDWLIALARQGKLPTSKKAQKPYLVRLLGDWPVYDPESVWARVANAPVIQEAAREYLSQTPYLKAFNLWYTVPSHQPPRDSQLWHQDVDDVTIFKVFIYLTDVTAEAGSLTYMRGTQQGGTRVVAPIDELDYAGIPRVTDAAMVQVVPPSEWITATGPRGTLIYVDTSGWHKGGYGTVDRMVFTALYTTLPGGKRYFA